jgi:hypothetical protein
MIGGIEWRDRVLVLDEIAQAAVLLLANRQVKAERLLGDIQLMVIGLSFRVKPDKLMDLFSIGFAVRCLEEC